VDCRGEAAELEIHEALTASFNSRNGRALSDREPQFSYDEIAEAYASGVDNAPYNAFYERPATLALLPDVSGAHILDAGCGSGFYTEELVRRGARVSAIDASMEMIRHAERRLRDLGVLDTTSEPPAPQHASVRTADLTAPFDFLDDASVDGILSALVLHYLRDWGPTLAEFRRILKPAGWLLLSTHHPATEASRFDISNYFATEELEDYWSWVGRVRFYRRPLTAIIGAFTDAGFVIDRLVEPRPTEWFREEKPEAYARLLKHPEFLIVRARPASGQVA
jgi:SAM-dependent methyltransferase